MKTDPAIIEKIVLLMVSGLNKADLEKACKEKLGIKSNQVNKAIKEAKLRLTRTADYNRDEQLGTAITRMNDIYSRSIRSQDIKTALIAQRDINKLLDLYRESNRESPDLNKNISTEKSLTELAAIARHLLPLKLADEGYPLSGHARIAAERIREGAENDKE